MSGHDTRGFMAMKGDGYYSRATVGARLVMDNAVGLVLTALDRQDAVSAAGAATAAGEPFRATDMGCADAGTSMGLWAQVMAHARRSWPERPIELIYTDLPRNDFSQTFRNALGLSGEDAWLNHIDNAFVLASATSFLEQITPDGSLDLGFSATASHYISAAPCEIAGHVHMVGAAPDERAQYEARGAEEWARMLYLRARELKPGGRLCLFNFGIDEQGRYLGNTGGVNMFDAFARHWAGLCDDGVISARECAAANFPQCYRDEAGFVAPLQDEASAAYRAGLRLEHVESRVVRCPFEQEFSEKGGDPAAFAAAYIPTLRSWSEPTFANALDAARPAPERAAILDGFYARYQAEVAANPTGHAMDYVHIYLVCRKQG